MEANTALPILRQDTVPDMRQKRWLLTPPSLAQIELAIGQQQYQIAMGLVWVRGQTGEAGLQGGGKVCRLPGKLEGAQVGVEQCSGCWVDKRSERHEGGPTITKDHQPYSVLRLCQVNEKLGSGDAQALRIIVAHAPRDVKENDGP